MIRYRVERFLAAWREEDPTTRAFLAWDAANTLLAFALLLSSFALIAALNSLAFERTLLLGYVAVAVCWLCSVFAIGPVYDRVAPDPDA
ncbi:MAG: hypothetical protein ABEJ40_02060 [Haloarculaceae archaeon]